MGTAAVYNFFMFKRLWGSPWTGAVVYVALIMWEGLLLLGAPVGLTKADQKSYLLWGLVALFVASVQSFYALATENNRLKKALDERQKIRTAKELIGQLLEHLSISERKAYDGSDSIHYDALMRDIENAKMRVKYIAVDYLDLSFESRFLAVNVLDVQLDEATRMNFVSRAQGSFWSVYQQIKGWRIYLSHVLSELSQQ